MGHCYACFESILCEFRVFQWVPWRMNNRFSCVSAIWGKYKSFILTGLLVAFFAFRDLRYVVREPVVLPVCV